MTGMGGLLDGICIVLPMATDSQDDILNDENKDNYLLDIDAGGNHRKPSVANGLAPTQITMTQGEPDSDIFVGMRGTGVEQRWHKY